MATIRGHFDGKVIVLDEPVPEGVAPNARVEVVFEPQAVRKPLAGVKELARPLGLPKDFAAQHHHYTKGLPKR